MSMNESELRVLLKAFSLPPPHPPKKKLFSLLVERRNPNSYA